MLFLKEHTEVRRAVVADAEAIARVHIASKQAAYAELVPESVLAELSVPQRPQKWQNILEGRAFETFIAENNGKIVGVLSCGVTQDSDSDPQVIGEIRSVYVSPEHWQQGIGRMLMDEALGRLKQRSFREVTLWALLPTARRFYESFGFTFDGTEKVGPLIKGYDLEVTDVRYRRNL